MSGDLDLAEFKDLFVDEAQEHLRSLNAALLAMEQSPGDVGRVDTMFRAAHSLKGGAAMMRYTSMAELAHGVEDVLHELREGQWPLVSSLADLLFVAFDQLQALLEAVAADRQVDVDIAATLIKLHSYNPDAVTGATLLQEPAAPAPEPVEPARSTQAGGDRVEQNTMLRVDVGYLDVLLNIFTEMVIHHSLMDRLGRRYKLPALDEALEVHQQHLDQLRDAVLKMRLVPLGQIFDRYPRMVRDLLKLQGKQAQFVVDGAEVEMDRMALEALGEPLVHLLRNAIDHGLEPPAWRVAAGKPASGTLRLSAFRQRDAVIIEVADDGQGMNVAEIATAALERRIITADQAGEMARDDVLALICHPGFSMTKEVTAVSGRGVGMSVVKRRVEGLRGSLTIMTQAGQGTTFRLRVPLKLSLMPAILVRAGSETYAMPMTGIEQIIALDPQQIERVADRATLAVNGEILPLHRLGVLLQVPDATLEPRYALIIRHDGHVVGLCVDMVEGYEEVVVKPLPESIRDTPGLSGVTMLGEGRTVLILDEDLSRIGGSQ